MLDEYIVSVKVKPTPWVTTMVVGERSFWEHSEMHDCKLMLVALILILLAFNWCMGNFTCKRLGLAIACCRCNASCELLPAVGIA